MSSFINFKKLASMNSNRIRKISTNLLEWIENTKKMNEKYPSLINFLEAVKEHYLRNFSDDPKIRQMGISLEQAKNIISSALNRHKEYNLDLQSLHNATETYFSKD